MESQFMFFSICFLEKLYLFQNASDEFLTVRVRLFLYDFSFLVYLNIFSKDKKKSCIHYDPDSITI